MADIEVEETLRQLSIEEKIALTSGTRPIGLVQDFPINQFHQVEISGIPLVFLDSVCHLFVYPTVQTASEVPGSSDQHRQHVSLVEQLWARLGILLS